MAVLLGEEDSVVDWRDVDVNVVGVDNPITRDG